MTTNPTLEHVEDLLKNGISTLNLEFAKHLSMEDVMVIKIILKRKTSAKKAANNLKKIKRKLLAPMMEWVFAN